MDIEYQIRAALAESHPEDLAVIKKYVQWVKFRRKIHDAFYQSVHWVQSSRRIHWVGR